MIYRQAIETPLDAVAPPLPDAGLIVPRFKARLPPPCEVGLYPKLRAFDLI